MPTRRTAVAAVAVTVAVAVAVACAPSKPAVCESLERFRAAAKSKAAPCESKDGGSGVSINFDVVSPEVCAAKQSACTENDKELIRMAADCAERYAACDPSDGGALAWVFGFALGCASTAQNVSGACQAAVVVSKDGG